MTPDADALPRRPRRRLATPTTLVPAAVLIAALGFIGGVQVQKSAADSGSGAGGFARGARAGGFGGAPGSGTGGGAEGGGTTVGSVASVDDRGFYVKNADGTTVRVKTNKQSKVTRTAVSKAADVHPGDTVIVQGTTSGSGTVTATSVTATAKNAAGGLGGMFAAGGGVAGGFGGGAPQTQERNDG